MEDALHRPFVDFSSAKLSLLTGRIETCLASLNEDQVWARGGPSENAVGNLALHLCGNVRQWIISGVGGQADIRDRDSEFSATGGPSTGELSNRLRGTVEEAIAVIEAVSVERMTQRVVIQKYDVTVMEAIYHVVEHFSMHTGQIIFVTKMLTGSDLGFYRHLRTTTAHGEPTP